MAHLTSSQSTAILQSATFSLFKGAELHLDASLSIFGARLYICADDESFLSALYNGKQNILENCELLLGPKVEENLMNSLVVQLDPVISHFVFVATHDNVEQFGEAEVVLNRIQITTSEGELLC